MQSLTCIHCGNRHDVHIADESALDRFAEASGWARVPAVALRIVSAHGSIGRNVLALANGVAAHPGQSVVASSDGATCWVLHASASSVASFKAAAAAAGWRAEALPPPGASEWACSIACVASAMRRETDDSGQHFFDGGRHAHLLPKPQEQQGHTLDVVQSCVCGASLTHPASDSEAQKAERRKAHGWNGSFCSTTCALRSGPIHQKQPEATETPAWPPAPTPLPAQRAPLRTGATTKAKAR